MKNDRWAKLEHTFHAAAALPAGDREVYVERECAGDAELIAEVKTLLKSFDSGCDILDEPVFELGLKAISDTPRKDMSGSTIGPYELQERIGAGGMGEVYRAVDTRLNRLVALKFLSNALEDNKEAKRQLVKEAQAVAMLDHPNICAVHGIEQHDDAHFIVMQYIEGQTLADCITQEEIDVDEFKSIARQIVSAVAFAHSHGVIHRDLKPGNIMLTADGKIKVLDFGLAKVIPQTQLLGSGATNDISRFSQNGLIIGTVSYMSPEQLRGEKLDYRSDIFSVGIILYELLAKQNPFHRDSQAETIAAILAGEPLSLKESRRFPQSLIKITEKCLAKDRNSRFQSAAEILVELDKAEPAVRLDLASSKRSRFLLRAALAAGLLVLAIWLGVFMWSGPPVDRTLAVMPFAFDVSEKEYLADGLSQSLIDKLGGISGIKVKSEYLVSRYKGKVFDPLAAGRELGVDAVYTGEILSRENALVLATKLVRISDGFVLDTDEQSIDEANLIELQENLATRIAGKIKALSDDDRSKLATKDTDNPEAKLLFIRGKFFLERQKDENDLLNAAQDFEKATNLVPLYANAWTGLADAYTLIGVPGHNKGGLKPEEVVARAKFAALKANEIDSISAEPQVSLAMTKLRFDWDWDGAEQNFREAIRRDPALLSAHLGLSNLLIIKGRITESLDEARIAKQLAPFSPIPDLSLARTYSFDRNWTEMEKVLNDALTRYPDHKRLTYFRGLLFLRTEKWEEAIQIFEKTYAENKLYGAAPLAWAYARAGRKREAENILAALEVISKDEHVSSQEWAWVHFALGERDKGFEYLRRACDERFSVFPYALIDPALDEFRGDPRFASLRKCGNLA